MKFEYRPIRLSPDNQIRLEQINNIIGEYQEQGYRLTLRQLYYQLVSRDFIPNKASEYEKLSVLLKEGRMGGIVDWDAIEDRLRIPSKPSSFESPEKILMAAAEQFEMPRMEGQECYIEVWVEKDALSGVLSRVTRPYHIPILVNRGYSSASAMHDAFLRFNRALKEGSKSIRVLYLGDFDPSGVDMVRDVEQRIREFFLGTSRRRSSGKIAEAGKGKGNAPKNGSKPRPLSRLKRSWTRGRAANIRACDISPTRCRCGCVLTKHNRNVTTMLYTSRQVKARACRMTRANYFSQ